MDHLSLSLFGHFQLSINQQELYGFTSEKGQVLLAYLVLENQQSHTRKKLSSLFWPNVTPKSAQNSLRQTLYRLKTAFAECGPFEQFVSSNRQSIRFDESCSYWTDVNEFQQLITQRKVEHNEFDEKVQLYERLSRLYRGEFLAGITIDDSAELDSWLISRRTWFHSQGLETLHKLIESYCTLSHYDLAQIYVDRLLRLDPLNERAFEKKIAILLQKGQSAEASSAYERFKSLLVHQIGIEPNPAIKALLQSQPTSQKEPSARATASKKSLIQPRSAKSQALPKALPLPAPPTHHSAFLQDGLSQSEPINAFINEPAGKTLLIHGLPGVGKTVLAAEIARNVAGERPIFYVDLRRLNRDKCQHVITQLQGAPTIVLDHLDRVPQVTGLIADIFATCERATVIGVSRLPLKRNRPDTVTHECAGLSRSQAPQLILSHASDILTDKFAAQITEQLAGHPAAMLELLRWNQIFPWEMIAQKIQFGEFLWDETPLADWFDTIWQSLSETELHFAARFAQNESSFCPEELGAMPLDIARSAMRFVERGLIKKTDGGVFRFHPLFCTWVQSRANLVSHQIPNLEAAAGSDEDDQLFDGRFQERPSQIGTFE